MQTYMMIICVNLCQQFHPFDLKQKYFLYNHDVPCSYDELSVSHRQSRRQLAKKDKALKVLKCETEQLHSKCNKCTKSWKPFLANGNLRTTNKHQRKPGKSVGESRESLQTICEGTKSEAEERQL